MPARPLGAPSRARLLAAGALAACTLTATALPVSAAVSDDPKAKKAEVDQQIDDLRKQLDDTSKDVADAFIALKRTQLQLPEAQKRLDAASSARDAADARNAEMEAALQVARANEAKAADELAGTKAEISKSRKQVANFAVELYQNAGMGELSVAMSATSPDDFATKMAMTDTVMDVQNRRITLLSSAQADESATQARLVALRKETATRQAQAADALSAAEAARAQADSAKSALDDLATAQTEQAKALEAKKKAESERLGSMEEESSKLAAVLKQRAEAAARAAAAAKARAEAAGQAVPKSEGPPPGGGGFLAKPVNGPITSEFGMRFHPILGYSRLHAGMDFGAPCGTPVYAAASGSIVSAGWGGGYGNRIVVEHGGGLATTYNHLSAIVVHSGSVSRGQLIGREGTTGLSTGCHLHFETRLNGTPVNPRNYL
ncbi:MAG: peptidoglycan DD-metalloendopeptidase family protein [Micrococcales bacterium]|nr:peptidoglycan DD-metalloendopeptidase family protein [Micrococcales bacterium]